MMEVGRATGVHPLERAPLFWALPGRASAPGWAEAGEVWSAVCATDSCSSRIHPMSGAVSRLQQWHLHPGTLSKRRASSAHTGPRMTPVTQGACQESAVSRKPSPGVGSLTMGKVKGEESPKVLQRLPIQTRIDRCCPHTECGLHPPATLVAHGNPSPLR